MDVDTEALEEATQSSLSRLPYVGILLSVLGLLFLITTRTPGSGGPMVILLFLLLSFVSILSASAVVLGIFTRLLGRAPVSRIRLLYTSVAIAAGVVFLIGLQTLRQLQFVDLVLIVLFELLLNFYLLRRF